MSVSVPVVDDFDAERLRIARDLHDVISYGFATINLQAGAAVHVAEKQPQQAVEALRAITALSKDALHELRGILGVLRHSGGSDPVGVGLEHFDSLVETTTRAGVPTRLEVSGWGEALPMPVASAAYRIVQEALTNVLRHAGGASAWVSLAKEGARLRITVEDDGKGPIAAAEQGSHGSGLGILGMRERAVALGGDLEAGSRPEGGFRVSAHLPVGS
jgi:signal transduction histidine kinase